MPEARPQRPKQQGKAAPKRKSRLTAANIAVGGTVIGTAVGALPQYLQLPAQALGAGIVSVGAVAVWQQLKAKAEERRSKQRPPDITARESPLRIDKSVEPDVREAFAASVAGERERFDAAVTKIGRSGDEFANTAIDLAIAIDAVALLSVHDGKRPSDRQLLRLSGEFAAQEDEWADIDAATTHAYLTALADRKSPLDSLSLADVFFTAFAVGGWLLSAFLPEDGEWAPFLDEILDRLESEAAE